MEVGEIYKVHLDGESPWAECVEVKSHGAWVGRIDNDLICGDEHGYSYQDLVEFDRNHRPNK